MSAATVPLGDLALKIQDGPFGSNLKSSHYVDEGVRVVRLQNIGVGYFDDRDRAFISQQHFDSLKKHACAPGDVLVATLGDPIVRAALQPVAISLALNKADCIQVRCDTRKAVPAYVVHYLNSGVAQAHATALAHGQTRPRVNLSQLREIPIPLPPIGEQRRIAAVLDAAAALRAKRRQALAKLDTLTQAIFLDMFGDSPWPKGKLGAHVPTTSGGTPSRSRQDYFVGQIPWVKSGELATGLVLETEERITVEAVANSSAKRMPAGTVLLAMYGATAGEVATLGIEAATNQAICCLSPTNQVTGPYLAGFLRSVKVKLVRMAAGGAQPNISQAIVRNLDLPLPPVKVQASYARRASGVAGVKANLVDSELQLGRLFASLQQRAFQGDL